MTNSKDKTLADRVRRLAAIAAALREGGDFSITRLTVIKALCRQPRDAALFAVHLAVAARDQIARGPRPRHLDPTAWEHHQKLAVEAVTTMQKHLTQPSVSSKSRLGDVLARVEHAQNTVVPVAWGQARVIDDQPLLVIEHALQCLLSPHVAPQMAYRAARAFVERYDPRYGTGLIPASAPFVEEIAAFFGRHHVGRPRLGSLPQASRKPVKTISRHGPRKAPRPDASSFATAYPAITRWVEDCGWIEIGYSEGSSSFLRVLDIGGLIWEGNDTYPSLDAALAALEKALSQWIAQHIGGR